MKYSLDTSSLIEPWRKSYPPDVFPSLWEVDLPAVITAQDLRATREVWVELEKQDDEILDWARAQPDLFLEVDEAVQHAVTAILGQFPSLVDPHSGRSGADPFVIALAQVNGCAVVTEERARSLINPKIPDVCGSLSINCMNVLGVIREQGWSYR